MHTYVYVYIGYIYVYVVYIYKHNSDIHGYAWDKYKRFNTPFIHGIIW